METLDNEVRGHLYDVLEGATPLDDFERWFVTRTWDVRSPFVAEVRHLLAERSLLSESRFLAELRLLATTIADVPSFATSSTAGTIRPQALHVGGSETIRDRLELADT